MGHTLDSESGLDGADPTGHLNTHPSLALIAVRIQVGRCWQ